MHINVLDMFFSYFVHKNNYHSWIFSLISNSKCQVIDWNFDLLLISGSGLLSCSLLLVLEIVFVLLPSGPRCFGCVPASEVHQGCSRPRRTEACVRVCDTMPGWWLGGVTVCLHCCLDYPAVTGSGWRCIGTNQFPTCCLSINECSCSWHKLYWHVQVFYELCVFVWTPRVFLGSWPVWIAVIFAVSKGNVLLERKYHFSKLYLNLKRVISSAN